MTEANPREITFGSKYREFRKIEGSNNRDPTVVGFVFDFVLIELINQMYSLFRILYRLYGEIPLDKVLRNTPDRNQGHS